MISEEEGDFCSGISCSLVTYVLVNNPTTMCIQASLIGLGGYKNFANRRKHEGRRGNPRGGEDRYVQDILSTCMKLSMNKLKIAFKRIGGI